MGTIKENKLMLINVSLDYGEKIVLPYSDGIKLLEALSTAEIYSNKYSSTPSVLQLENDKITFSLLSTQSYAECKLAATLAGKSE
jgi:hypothetical protein